MEPWRDCPKTRLHHAFAQRRLLGIPAAWQTTAASCACFATKLNHKQVVYSDYW